MPEDDEGSAATLPEPTGTVEAVLGWRLDRAAAYGTLKLRIADGTERSLAFPGSLLTRLALAAVALFTERQQQEAPQGPPVLHPVRDWAVEPMPCEPEQRLLTLATVDSFTLTFLLGQADLEAIARAACSVVPASETRH
ncbi:hypothetical protein [Paracraurococcus lichenis]|uniref:Uncharacterized protein n=1 Tax=Paracraurococcus lichenis TaxID=3064888 RepID=A0ABT9E9U5_9PROT|nr:hypothetical protein [Paracraurococcus sp. LOR1-02]MDO9712835.1 hypothetical protein [Paracraurococcus sp. LOR1-02]